MRQRIQALAVAALTALSLQVHAAGSQSTPRTTINVTGAPAGSALELALNGGKISDGTPDANGEATFNVGFGSGPRRSVHVWVDRCKDNKIVRVLLVVDSFEEPPKDQDCDRKLAGLFWTNARAVTLDLGKGVLQGSRLLSPRNLAIAGGVVGGGLLVATAGGDDNNNSGGSNNNNSGTFNPAGNYQVTISRKSDPGEHFTFIQLMTTGILSATLSNVTMTITGPGGSNFVTVSGTFNSSTNRFVLTGSGTVAGRPNVGVRFEGSVTTSGAISGDYTMGTGGELPGGQAIVYSVLGQR